MKKIFVGLVNKLSQLLINRITYQEFVAPVFDRLNERPVEYAFVFESIAKYYPKSILDIGTGLTALPHLMANCGIKVTAIDNIRDYWTANMLNRHYWVNNDDITNLKLNRKFEMIVCVSTLEHIELSDLAIKNMVGRLTDMGKLVLTFPYNEKNGVANVYKLKGTNATELPKYATRAFCRQDLKRWEKDNQIKVIEQSYWDFFSGDYWTVGKMELPPKKVNSTSKHHITTIVFEKK
jgi:2-polyprenyl-3-methyl-5-hydroxy-6-metoxy-1,4-benzoquinol methylase